MRDMKMEGIVPPSLFPLVKDYLKWAYGAGYDQGGMDVTAHSKKAVAQINEQRKVVNVFSGIKEATRITHFPRTSIHRAIINETYYKAFLWKWIKTEEYEEAARDNFMY